MDELFNWNKEKWLPSHGSGARPVGADVAVGRGKENLNSKRWLLIDQIGLKAIYPKLGLWVWRWLQAGRDMGGMRKGRNN